MQSLVLQCHLLDERGTRSVSPLSSYLPSHSLGVLMRTDKVCQLRPTLPLYHIVSILLLSCAQTHTHTFACTHKHTRIRLMRWPSTFFCWPSWIHALPNKVPGGSIWSIYKSPHLTAFCPLCACVNVCVCVRVCACMHVWYCPLPSSYAYTSKKKHSSFLPSPAVFPPGTLCSLSPWKMLSNQLTHTHMHTLLMVYKGGKSLNQSSGEWGCNLLCSPTLV